ncbi:hypothetical protein CPB84DRAFT_863583 [Gymnopilus junonius]|uniref:F-box domain-containing protein n=1 Tax=Gymnopilus junonius TaxID=109634 RepID=A0A9P5NRD3_GYMJU|nr:hypothetical protein CPB84DRAFT_863583 [Gymnopilus junonius]
MSNEEIHGLAPDQPYIDGLPDEILEAVFLLNTVKEFIDQELVHDPHQTTISTTLVCKRWYDVAHNFSPLWSHVIDYERHPPWWIEELLRRSKSFPIDVGDDSIMDHVRLFKPRGKTVLSHIFRNSSRLRSINLHITVSPWELICEEFFQHPAPALEYLNLVTSTPFPDCLYPGPLFAHDAPRLRKFHLQRCLVDFSSPALTNLTELSVRDILAPPILSMRKPDHPLKVAPTVNGWLRILEQIPSLVYLILGGAIPHSTNEEIPISKVNLSNLRFLSVAARFPDGAALLSHLSMPPSCGIRLRFARPRFISGTEGTELLSFLSGRLSSWPDQTPSRYLQAKILSGDRIHFGNSRRIGHMWDMKESAM